MNHYEDSILGIVRDQQGRSLWIFKRTSTGTFKYLHILAQDENEEILIVQKADTIDAPRRTMIITMEDADGGFHQMIPQDMRETNEGCLGAAFAAATIRSQGMGADSLDDDWFQPLDRFKMIEWKPHTAD